MAELGENIVRRIAPFGVTVSTGIIQTCANENFILHDVAICNYLDRLLEGEMAKAATGDGTNRGELAARLDQLEKEANQVKMPVAYASMLYGRVDYAVELALSLGRADSKKCPVKAERCEHFN